MGSEARLTAVLGASFRNIEASRAPGSSASPPTPSPLWLPSRHSPFQGSQPPSVTLRRTCPGRMRAGVGSLCWGFTGALGTGHRGLFPRWGRWDGPLQGHACARLFPRSRGPGIPCAGCGPQMSDASAAGVQWVGAGSILRAAGVGAQAAGHKHRAAPLNPPPRLVFLPAPAPPIAKPRACLPLRSPTAALSASKTLSTHQLLHPQIYLRGRFQGGAGSPAVLYSEQIKMLSSGPLAP